MSTAAQTVKRFSVRIDTETGEPEFWATEDGAWVVWDGTPSENYGAKQLAEDYAALERRVQELEACLQSARGALADIGASSDMTVAVARTKANRVYMVSAPPDAGGL